MTIHRFAGDHRFLSNFYPAVVIFEGLAYPTAEHAYQAAKTFDPDIREGISQLHRPGVAKRIGQLVPLRDNWDHIRLDVMRTILASKFAETTALSFKLMQTMNDVLVEGNHWHDCFWGVCGCPRHEGRGENVLGKLLMERREVLWAQTASMIRV